MRQCKATPQAGVFSRAGRRSAACAAFGTYWHSKSAFPLAQGGTEKSCPHLAVIAAFGPARGIAGGSRAAQAPALARVARSLPQDSRACGQGSAHLNPGFRHCRALGRLGGVAVERGAMLAGMGRHVSRPPAPWAAMLRPGAARRLRDAMRRAQRPPPGRAKIVGMALPVLSVVWNEAYALFLKVPVKLVDPPLAVVLVGPPVDTKPVRDHP